MLTMKELKLLKLTINNMQYQMNTGPSGHPQVVVSKDAVIQILEEFTSDGPEPTAAGFMDALRAITPGGAPPPYPGSTI